MKFEEFELGQTYTTSTYEITRQDIMEFGARFDPQYMHIDEVKANQSIFKGIIASGLHTLCVTWKLWIDLDIVGLDVIGGVGMERLRFLHPVYPGDRLFVIARIVNLRPHNKKKDRGYFTVLLQTKNQNDETVLEAEVTGLVARVNNNY